MNCLPVVSLGLLEVCDGPVLLGGVDGLQPGVQFDCSIEYSIELSNEFLSLKIQSFQYKFSLNIEFNI